jgi:hypothetical protein
MGSKAIVFDDLIPLVVQGGAIFGTTILSQGVQHTRWGRRLMRFYNHMGIFSNFEDDLEGVEWVLARASTVSSWMSLALSPSSPVGLRERVEGELTSSDKTEHQALSNGRSSMSEHIVYIDRSKILDGKLEELKEGLSELVEFVDAHEPQLISYAFFINEEAARMTVVAIHPDSASLEFHMEIAGPNFRKLARFVRLMTIEVYGRPSDRALKQLRQKAEMLGEDGSVVVQQPHAGFARFPN